MSELVFCNLNLYKHIYHWVFCENFMKCSTALNLANLSFPKQRTILVYSSMDLFDIHNNFASELNERIFTWHYQNVEPQNQKRISMK